MELKKYIMQDAFCMPKGALGQIGGRLMALDRGLPAWVLDLLTIDPSDSVLEIGAGPGVGVELAAARVQKGLVVGVDPSETMLEMARRRNREHIEVSRVEFRLGTVDKLPLEGRTFDAAMAINSLHLWSDPVRGLMEVRRILRSGGRIAVAMSRFSSAVPDKFGDYLNDAGFVNISIQTGDRGTCALGST
jgi:ubiquinone/menaquinone biosynthesis C-methylase UbiE